MIKDIVFGVLYVAFMFASSILIVEGLHFWLGGSHLSSGNVGIGWFFMLLVVATAVLIPRFLEIPKG